MLLLFIAVLHTVEFQKRGLPHAHIIIWNSADTSNPTPAMIDKHISAEIPDPKLDPLGYVLVAEHMIHGPCGKQNPKCPCMKNNKCSKHFPKTYQDDTSVTSTGFATYKRGQATLFVIKGGCHMDNRWVVPYNMLLLKKYQAHINVEWCNKTTFIKYLFKYVTKGADCSKAYLQRVKRGQQTPFDDDTQTINEVKEYLHCRYICEQDACWRMFGYDIHRHFPAVERMPVHMPNENFITFSARAKMDRLLSAEFLRRTMLTQWFVCNELFPEARTLTYPEFPSKWVWDQRDRRWSKRKQRHDKIGRLHYVHPLAGERYYLRMLLLIVKGATSYEHLRFHNRVYHHTFKEACKSRGLLSDDHEWYDAFDEAAAWATSPQLRSLFVTMILFCEVGDENTLFEKVWRHLADDIIYQYRDMIGDPSYQLPDSMARDYLLDELSALFSQSGKNITDFNLPPKTHAAYPILHNRFVEEELSHPLDPLIDMNNPTVSLNEDQKNAFHKIVQRVEQNEPGFFFVAGYGGTGKTYLWNRIVGYLRRKNKIVLTVASSGVAALLLPGGRTAHSRFKIPCEVEDDMICDVSRGTMLSELIELTSLVIWDEALMANRKCFEALDRTFRDIEKVKNPEIANIPFGGKVVVLGGDLRQILPVVEDGNKQDVIAATIIASRLWSHVEVLSLKQNMRLLCSPEDPIQQQQVAAFNKWILDIGENKIPTLAKEGEDEGSWITIPQEFLVSPAENRLAAIVKAIYPDFHARYKDPIYLVQRAILAPTNELTHSVNDYMVPLVPGREKEYFSSDTIAKSTAQHEAYDLLYPIEFLNSINGNNFPQHRIVLKQGILIMLLRNLNQRAGLCNGTRLIVTSIGEWTIEAKIMNGSHTNQSFAIPRITLSLKNNKWPFVLQRRQYPIRVCYAMTINKSQGQTLSAVGLYLPKPVFTHGQLYVAVSRVTAKQGLKIYIEDDEGRPTDQTRNVVYTEILQHLS